MKRCCGWTIPLCSSASTGTRADRAADTVDAIEQGGQPHRRGRPDPAGTGRDAKSYRQGLPDAGAGYIVEARLGAMLQYQLDKLPIDYIEKRNAIVDAVTLEDAKRAASRLCGGKALSP